MKTLLPIIGLAVLLSSCIKNNPDPSWLQVNEWQLQVNPNAQYPTGELTENISQAWIYVDDELMGVFELPVKIPVLKSGSVKIQIFPAILDNGISATKKIYPFMESYVSTIDLTQNEETVVDPVTMYFENTKFWIEDFEDAGIQIEDDPSTSAANIQSSDDPAIIQPFNGTAFGRITLDATDTLWVGYTNSNLDIPNGEVYLEIDYHNTNRLTTGVLRVSPNKTEDNLTVQLNPQDDDAVVWKKIYISLSEIINSFSNEDYFRISFQALIDDNATAGEINIDNVKVVYF